MALVSKVVGKSFCCLCCAVCVCVRAQNRLADACAHEGGLGAGGRLLWKGASCSMGFMPSGFFFSLPFLPIPAPKRTRTGWQEEHAEKDLTV